MELVENFAKIYKEKIWLNISLIDNGDVHHHDSILFMNDPEGLIKKIKYYTDKGAYINSLNFPQQINTI